jgi:hypothetical protein
MCMDLGAAAFCSFEGEMESTSRLFRDAMVVAGASLPRPFPTDVRGLADFHPVLEAFPAVSRRSDLGSVL